MIVNLAPTDPPWQVTREKIDEAVRRIVEFAHPAKVILFGSAARGELHRDSDADFLVVLDRTDHPRHDSVRIRRALSQINMPVDIVVVSADHVVYDRAA
jgi:predicted nucleotidyltransferase